MTARFTDHFLKGQHADLPSVGTVPVGAKFSCLEHKLIYESTGLAWAVWSEGVAGPQGEQGPIGADGPEGPQGPPGLTGEQGPQGAQGVQGVQGPKGDKGDPGDQGPQGDQGVAGPVGPAGLNWRGAWDDATDYVADDAVSYENASWFASEDPPTGEVPAGASAFWQLLAARGADGPQGPQGLQGPPGSDGAQGLQGEQGPEGAQGIQGPPGADGAQGPEGPAGPGLPAGGTVGQIIAKVDGTDYNTEWVDLAEGGGGGLFRGTWALSEDVVTATYDFADGTIPAAFTSSGATVENYNAPFGGAVQPLPAKDVSIAPAGDLQLDLADADPAEKVRFWTSSQLSNGSFDRSEFHINGVAQYQRGQSDGARPWGQETFNIAPGAVLRWYRANDAGGMGSDRYLVAHIELLRSATNSYNAGEYVIHDEKLWKATQDNPGEPGISGWTEVPFGLTQVEADELYQPLETLTPATYVGASSGNSNLDAVAFSCPLPAHSAGDLVIGWSDAETGVVPLPTGYSQLTAVATTRSFWKLTSDTATAFTHGAGGRWASALWAAYRGASYANLIAAATGSTTAGFTDTDMCKVLYLVEHTGNTVAASVTGATLRHQKKMDNANSNVAIYEDDVTTGTVPARTFGSAVRINTVALYPVDAQVFTSTEKTKLATVQDRANHTGAQAISTVTGLQTALDGKAAAAAGVPIGGTTGQVLAKNSNTNLDLEWVDQSAGGGSAGGMAYNGLWSAGDYSVGDVVIHEGNTYVATVNTSATPQLPVSAYTDDFTTLGTTNTQPAPSWVYTPAGGTITAIPKPSWMAAVPDGATHLLQIHQPNATDAYATLTLTFTEDGTIDFDDLWSDHAASSNFGRFLIDGVEQHTVSTLNTWAHRSYSVAAGEHAFQWRLQKFNFGLNENVYAVANLETTGTGSLADWDLVPYQEAYDRANHTGTQEISTVAGLQAALDDKADKPVVTPPTFVGATTNQSGAGVTSYNITLPGHVIGDLLIVGTDKGANETDTPAGWSELYDTAGRAANWQIAPDTTTALVMSTSTSAWWSHVAGAYRGASSAVLKEVSASGTAAAITDSEASLIVYVASGGGAVMAAPAGTTLRTKIEIGSLSIALFDAPLTDGVIAAKTFTNATKVQSIALYPSDDNDFSTPEKTKLTALPTAASLQSSLDEKVTATSTLTKLHGPITQAAYDALTPAADTLYIIVD